jgi:hypothetical protein
VGSAMVAIMGLASDQLVRCVRARRDQSLRLYD